MGSDIRPNNLTRALEPGYRVIFAIWHETRQCWKLGTVCKIRDCSLGHVVKSRVLISDLSLDIFTKHFSTPFFCTSRWLTMTFHPFRATHTHWPRHVSWRVIWDPHTKYGIQTEELVKVQWLGCPIQGANVRKLQLFGELMCIDIGKKDSCMSWHARVPRCHWCGGLHRYIHKK